MRVVISSGHGRHVSGAVGIINEVAEARRVVPRAAHYLRSVGGNVQEFHDDISTTQAANLNRIVSEHNRHTRDLDVSVHFNAASRTDQPRGVEVLYRTEENMASRVSRAISDASGLRNRGAKRRKMRNYMREALKAFRIGQKKGGLI